MSQNNDSVRIRIRIASLVWIPIAVALICRYYVVQVKKHDYYFSEAKKRYTSVRRTIGRRGEILDRDGYLIVGNRPCVSISCSPSEIASPVKRMKLAHILSRHLDKPAAYYSERLVPTRPVRDKDGNIVRDRDGSPKMRKNQYLQLGRTVPMDAAAALKAQLAANGIPSGAFSFQDTYMRTYPKKRMLANVIGYLDIVDDSVKPRSGLEKQLSDETEPETGRIEVERARDGIPLNYGLQNIRESRDGKNIYLTISEPIQSILEEELDAAFEKWNPDTLYAAIADPEGNILALAQRPNFDPGDRSTLTKEARERGAVRTLIAENSYEPGSIMKPFSIAKALDWGVVTPDQRIDCEKGRWIYMRRPMTDTHPYDRLSVAEVIQKSSNIDTAKIALMLGSDRVCKALSLFGFGTKTGLPFPIEVRGSRPVIREGDAITVTRMPIGYAIRVTPLQILRAYCTLANGGRFPKMRLIDRIVDPATGEVETVPKGDGVQVFERPEALKALIEMMITVTQNGGTAVQAHVRGYDVAGKTGTSRKHGGRKVGYLPGQYYASFAGFVPAKNPRMVMVITADHPRGASYGGVVSGPIFARTAERVLKLLNVPPDHPEELEDTKKSAPKKPVQAASSAVRPEPAPKRKPEPKPVIQHEKAAPPSGRANRKNRPAKVLKPHPASPSGRGAAPGPGKTAKPEFVPMAPIPD